ncbi:MAG: hypothetical protein ACYCX9_09770 [Candidatus Dormibacteria bacterium]|jgi:uncharacterized protein HemX
MTTIAASRPARRTAYLPFDEDESQPNRARERTRLRTAIAWVSLPLVAALTLAATGYIYETAQGTALTYQVASLQAQKAQLANTSAVLAQELQATDSAGALNAAAASLGLSPQSAWRVITPPTTGGRDPLVPALAALKGA